MTKSKFDIFVQDDKHIKPFEGLEKFEEMKDKVLKDVTNKAQKQKLLKAFNPTPGMKDKWLASIKGANVAVATDKEIRMENMLEINNEIANSNKKKRKISIDTETDDENNKATNKKIKLEPEVIEDKSEDKDALAKKGATRRQLDALREKEEKERKEKEKGPGWYYELVPVTAPPPGPAPVPAFGQIVSGRCCLVCEEPGNVWKCRGQCQGHYHPRCVGADADKVSAEQFKCNSCETGVHACGICGDKTGTVSKCNMSSCGKWFHTTCLTRYTIWPQHKINNGSFYCPDHTCHTCACDNPRDPVMKYNEKLMHCVRCPTAYHAGDHCVAAGTIQITKTDIICPKHYKPPPKTKKGGGASHVNTNWCFICSKGGTLVMCDNCPASFHEECLKLSEPVGDKYYCDECQSGRLPLYNDILWAKWGAYRWWPALVLHPTLVPDNIEKVINCSFIF